MKKRETAAEKRARLSGKTTPQPALVQSEISQAEQPAATETPAAEEAAPVVAALPSGINAVSKSAVTPSKPLNSNVIYARKGNSERTFSKTAWGLMGNDKNGWAEYVPTPPEVQKLKK